MSVAKAHFPSPLSFLCSSHDALLSRNDLLLLGEKFWIEIVDWNDIYLFKLVSNFNQNVGVEFVKQDSIKYPEFPFQFPASFLFLAAFGHTSL